MFYKFPAGKNFNNEGVEEKDSTIFVTGHVYDSASNEPVGGATLTYETLPYGNFIGITCSRASDGAYQFRTFGRGRYKIEVKAENYETTIDSIYPDSVDREGKLTKDFFLVYSPDFREVIKLEHLIFDLGKSEIKPESHEELDNLVKIMKESPGMIIRLEGHTDFRGGRSNNLKLSQKRVDEVKNYLIKRGIDPNRITTKAFGGSRPISRKASEEAARINRRVEVRIIKR